MSVLAPVRARERVRLVDALRGFALAGVLLVNMQRYVEELPGTANALADVFIDLFASGKFYPLFAALFGVGFAIQWSRARERGSPFVPIYLRRLGVLFCIGVVLYVTLERNDILIAYAVLGLPLLVIRNATVRTVQGLAIVFLVCAIFAGVALDLAEAQWPASRDQRRQQVESELTQARVIFKEGSYPELMQVRVEILVNQTRRAAFYTAWLHFFAMFLLGWWAELTGVFRTPGQFKRSTRIACGAGFAVGLLFAVLQVFGHRAMSDTWWTPGVVAGVTAAAGTALAIAYAAALTLAWQWPKVPERLRAIVWAGRMSLTNFVLQYAIMFVLFHHYGFGLYKNVGSAASIAITSVIYAAQLALSGLWLSYFRQGPVEWVWRTLTYGTPQELRA